MTGRPNQPKTEDEEGASRLEWALEEVRGWLDVKLRTGSYASGFAWEMAQHMLGRIYNVHTIYDEIGILEGDRRRPSQTKPATRFQRPPLTGFWHKHHCQARFIPRNLKEESKVDGVIESVLASYIGQYIDEFADRISHDLTIGLYNRRARRRKLTGEFIVYERLADGSNHYLTLGEHGDYEAIRARIDLYRRIDQELALNSSQSA